MSTVAPSTSLSFKDKLLAWFIWLFYWLLTSTLRIKVISLDFKEQAQKLHDHGSYTLALWHENLYSSIVAHKNQHVSPIISLSRDGDFVSFVCAKLGFKPIRGSTSRGGLAAKDQLINLLEQGTVAAITVDGPKGPYRKVKRGVLDIAMQTQSAILPMTTIAEQYWTLSKSWDKAKIPKPFSRVIVNYGEPLLLNSDRQQNLITLKTRLASRLNVLDEETKKAFAQWQQF